MKALSIRQPWAWLIANGWKNIENRDWYTGFRGRFYVHAAKGMTLDEYIMCLECVRDLSPLVSTYIPPMTELQRGGIVGEATLIDCVTSHTSGWFQGRFGFVLVDQRPLPFLPCRGALGFFEVPNSLQSVRPA